MRKISITDITLKKLAEERGLSLLFREKTAVAACADSIGADAVELAAIKKYLINPVESREATLEKIRYFKG